MHPNSHNTTAIYALVGFLLCAVSAFSQKIGYVSSDAIKSKYEPYLMAEQRLNQMVQDWKSELAQYQADIDGAELEMRKNRLIWTDVEKEQYQRELDQKKKKRDDLARQVFEPGGKYDQEAEQLMKGIWEKIYLGIQQVAAAEGYDIVWDKSTDPLVYVNARYDLTVKVMKALGINADSLEKKQNQVIETDPRNKQVRETRSRSGRRRSTSRPEPSETPEVEPAPRGTITPPGLPPDVPVQSHNPADSSRTKEEIPR